MKIAFIAAELEPFSKTGGLASVANALPRAIAKLKHEVIVITPFYGKVINHEEHGLKMIASDIPVRIPGRKKMTFNVWEGKINHKVRVFFVDNYDLFSKSKKLYGSENENARFAFFNFAVLATLEKINFLPDVIHCNDWHTGLIPFILKKTSDYEMLKDATTIFTIHNLLFQLGHNWWEIPSKKRDDGNTPLPGWKDKRLETINFAKRAIIHADAINAVSQQYAEEIMTKDFGEDLHIILKNREEKIFGIINGIDTNEYNPKTDPGLYKKYSVKSIQRKGDNKKHIQRKLGLSQKERWPLIVLTSRIATQKGFELIVKVLPDILRQNVQFVIMGDGDKKFVKQIKKIAKRFPKKLVYLPFDQDFETSLYAAGDFFLLPSKFEPCGLNQMIALRYGCVPIVRKIGGLADTVTDYNPRTGKGNGFELDKFTPADLLIALTRAMEAYKYQKSFHELIVRAMSESFGWEYPAKKYVNLYRKAKKLK